MKNKCIISLLGLSLMYFNQTKAQMSLGADVGKIMITDGVESLLSDQGLNLSGFSVYGKYNFNRKTAIGVNIGYYTKSINNGGSQSQFNVMPITGSIEYNILARKFTPYIGLDAGIYHTGFKFTFFDEIPLNISKGVFGLAPVIGVNYKVSDNFSIHTNLKCHTVLFAYGAASGLGVNLGVAYHL